MSTTVVHVNDARFRDNPDAVYIGRRQPRAKDARCRHDSPWQNRWRLSRYTSREFAIQLFERDVREMIKIPAARNALLALDGKVLGCWCKKRGDEPCHGDVIVKLIEELRP